MHNLEAQKLEDKMYLEIKELIENSKKRVITFVNTEKVILYWNIGKNIVCNFQSGNIKARYGTYLLKNLSLRLTSTYGKSYSKSNLEYMRRFYLYFPITQALPGQLSWTHYVELLKVKEENIRNFYMQECINSRWNYRELGRMIKSHLYERLLASNDKDNKLAVQGNIINTSKDLIKDPYILEFLNLENNYKEKDLEKEIINHLKEFLLELGKGFMYVGSEVPIRIGKEIYYVDLVFYNRILKCFVVIELKRGEITHKDIGQINAYINYYDKHIKEKDENKTVGILLSSNHNKVIVNYALPEYNEIYLSKYLLHLPSKEELIKEIKNTRMYY